MNKERTPNYKENHIQRLESCFAKYKDITFVAEHDGSEYVRTTYSDFRNEMLSLALALEDCGIKQGMHVALLGENRKEWLLALIALMYMGVTVVPISTKLSKEELLSQFTHSDTDIILVSPKHLDSVNNINKEYHSKKDIIIMDDKREYEGYKSMKSILNRKKYDAEQTNGFLSKALSLSLSTECAICYTTGTTDEPKGILLSQRTFYVQMVSSAEFLDLDLFGPAGSRTFMVLPLYHIFLLVDIFMLIENGYPMYFLQQGDTELESMLNISKNIIESKPRFMMVVPLILDNYAKAIEKRMEMLPRMKKLTFRGAQSITLKYRGTNSRRRTWRNKIFYPLVRLADAIVFSEIKKFFGGELKFFVPGGSSMSLHTWRFFESINIRIKNGYGLSEAGGAAMQNFNKVYCLGSVGIPQSKHFQVKIVDPQNKELVPMQHGEILLRSEAVMEGYWKNKEQTDAIITGDGWIRTGDYGYINEDGYIFVLGRIKSMLVNKAGEKFCGEIIENAIVSDSPYINQVMLCSHHDEIDAIIVPENKGITPDTIQAELERVRTTHKFPKMWFPSRFIIAKEPFSEKNNQLANTKMVRRNIIEAYRTEIDNLHE